MIAIKAKTIHTVTGGIIENGAVIIENGKIQKAGCDFAIPENAEVYDFPTGSICPGFIDAHTHVGLFGEGCSDAGNDGNEMTNPVTPHMRALDGIDNFDPAFPLAVEAGITTIMVMPGSANPIGGKCCIIKTFGGTIDNMIMVEDGGMKFALGENPKRVYSAQKKTPFTRMGTAAVIRETLYKVKNYQKKKALAKEEDKKDFEPDFVMEALEPVITRKVKAHIHCHQAYDIMTALRLADEFNLDITLEHCTEGNQIKEEIAKRKFPAVLSPMMHARGKVETAKRCFSNAAELIRAGIETAISTDGFSTQIRWLPINAGICVRYGMSEEEALASITIVPARIMGIADRVGSIESGKDADLFICDGHPLEAMTKPLMVIGGGKVLYRRED